MTRNQRKTKTNIEYWSYTKKPFEFDVAKLLTGMAENDNKSLPGDEFGFRIKLKID